MARALGIFHVFARNWELLRKYFMLKYIFNKHNKVILLHSDALPLYFFIILIYI